jgi:hypothetical protein
MESTSTISHTVMRRVRIIHTMRPILSGAAIASVLLVLALWGIGREVWVAHVVQNLELSAQAGHLLAFLAAAFANTRFVVQVLTLSALAALTYVCAEFIRTLRTIARFA